MDSEIIGSHHRRGLKRQFDYPDGVKLFVESPRPKTVSQLDDVRRVFEDYGTVLKVEVTTGDTKTRRQQGDRNASAEYFMMRYATSEEADRAILALHNKHKFQGARSPIKVRYAEKEQERLGLGARLFVGSIEKASKEQIRQIFTKYGQVEDVIIMRDLNQQHRGYGYVKYYKREDALEAINGFNGKYKMDGCELPMIVQFAEQNVGMHNKQSSTSNFQSHEFSHMQPSNPKLASQQNLQGARMQQSTWAGGKNVKPVTHELPAASVAPVPAVGPSTNSGKKPMGKTR